MSDTLQKDGPALLALARAGEDEYCRAALRMRHNEFWWYYHGLVPQWGSWKPFQDRTGRWWYQVKPGFAWPVDYFKPVANAEHILSSRWLMGWQCPVPAHQSDSQVWLNVIHDLRGYNLERVASNKRRAIRKGFRNLLIERADPSDVRLGVEASEVWNSHVERTGWNRTMQPKRFVSSWRELAHWPGTTVLTARDPARGGQLCSWLIARVIDDTVYVDTIASHTDRLEHRPNDTIIYQCLASAESMGIRHAHYSLKSKLTSLEAFKESLGFVAHAFPSRLKLQWPIGPILRMARPELYMRLQGDPFWSETDQRHRSLLRAGAHRPSQVSKVIERIREPALESTPAPRERLPFLSPLAPEDSQKVVDVARSWHVPPDVRPRYGWLVFSLDFVLASLQGSITDPQNIRRTPSWIMMASIVSALMAVGQFIIMILSLTPVISWFVEILARVFTRNAAGFFLRSCYWKARLKYLGPDTLIDQGVEIWGPANVSIGSNCHIDTNVRLAAGERRHKQKGFITIGNYVHLGPGVHIAGRGGVEIRDFVGIMSNAHLYSATGVIERPADPGQLISMSHMAPPDQQHIVEAPIFIDHYAFIGMMTRVLPGVKVGFGAVVHSNCELTRDVPPFANVGGVARGRQIGWRRPRRPSSMLKADQPHDSPAPNDGARPPAAEGDRKSGSTT